MPESPVTAPNTKDLALIQEIWPVSRETIGDFAIYADVLARWQRRINLVSPGTLAQFWRRHVADSLQCMALAPDARRWIDLGSGAGFPGLILAILQKNMESDHHLVESNQKKCAFLREVGRRTATPVKIHTQRIESVAKLSNLRSFDVVTARALAPLTSLLQYSAPFMGADTTGLFHKGRDYELEIEECRGRWSFDLVIHRSATALDSVLLEIRNPELLE